MEEKRVLPKPLSRLERKERRSRRHLRCEWCNKQTYVSRMVWDQVSRDDKGHYTDPERIMRMKMLAVFCCERDRCVALRPDVWTPSEWTGLVWLRERDGND